MMHYGVIGAMLACTVILFYNGRRGFIQGNVAKYGFYAFTQRICLYLSSL